MTDPKAAHPSDSEVSAAAVRAALLGVAGSAVLLTGLTFALFDGTSALGAAIGGALATANLWIFGRVARAFVAQRHVASWSAIAAIKFIALFIGVWLILKTEIIPPLALAVGYGALPIGITLGTLLGPKPIDLPSDSSGSDNPDPPQS